LYNCGLGSGVRLGLGRSDGLVLSNGHGSGGLSSEEEGKSHKVSKEGEDNKASVGNVDDVVVSAPDGVAVVVVLSIGIDSSSVDESSVVVKEGKALTDEDSSENDVNYTESNESSGQDDEEEGVSSSPGE